MPAIEVLDNPFASSADTELSEESIRAVAPSMPDTKVQSLLRAADRETWDKQEGINEKFSFSKQYKQLASNISAELGPFALNVYAEAQDLVEASVLRLINDGDRTGSFRGQNASGGSQWDIAQLSTQTFDGSASDRVYSTGTTGNFDIVPNFGGAADNTTTSLDNDLQSVFILGMYSSTNPRVVSHAELGVDDGEDRTSFDVYSHSNLGTLQAFDTPSAEYLTDDDSFDLNGRAVQNATTDAFPFGVDVNVASNLPGLGVQS